MPLELVRANGDSITLSVDSEEFDKLPGGESTRVVQGLATYYSIGSSHRAPKRLQVSVEASDDEFVLADRASVTASDGAVGVVTGVRCTGDGAVSEIGCRIPHLLGHKDVRIPVRLALVQDGCLRVAGAFDERGA